MELGWFTIGHLLTPSPTPYHAAFPRYCTSILKHIFGEFTGTLAHILARENRAPEGIWSIGPPPNTVPPSPAIRESGGHVPPCPMASAAMTGGENFVSKRNQFILYNLLVSFSHNVECLKLIDFINCSSTQCAFFLCVCSKEKRYVVHNIAYSIIPLYESVFLRTHKTLVTLDEC